MKVLSTDINRSYQPYANYGLNRVRPTVPSTNYCITSPNFGKNIKSSAINLPLNFVLSRLKQYSTDEYKHLSGLEKYILRQAYKLYNRTANDEIIESLHDDISENIKNHFDKKYGKNNYVVITIGRSLSSVGKVLGYKIGEENVKNIPMSNAEKYLSSSYIEQIKEYHHLDNFRKFLDGIGLNKDKIRSSKKKYIITDFCVSGDSLKGAKKLLKRNDVLGAKNIVSESIIDCIASDELKYNAQIYFHYCRLKNYSFVEKSQSLNNLQEKYLDTTKEFLPIRLMWFKLLDNQMLKNKTKVEGDLLPRCYKSVKNLFQKNIEEK